MKKGIHEEIRKKLSDKTCYVLITCDKASEKGEMEVEMSYEGDPLLAQYLLDGAKAHFDEPIEEHSCCC